MGSIARTARRNFQRRFPTMPPRPEPGHCVRRKTGTPQELQEMRVITQVIREVPAAGPPTMSIETIVVDPSSGIEQLGSSKSFDPREITPVMHGGAIVVLDAYLEAPAEPRPAAPEPPPLTPVQLDSGDQILVRDRRSSSVAD